jgi:hypothetical protein
MQVFRPRKNGLSPVFFMDEIAKFPRAYDRDAVTSTQQITRCRVFCSSPYGADGAYFRLMHDPTGAKKAHADRVVADAVGWMAALDFGRVAGGTVRKTLNVMNVTPGNAPLGSYAWRRAAHLAAAWKERGRSRS